MAIGIMQGRLGPPEDGRFQSFPRVGWREEFTCAAAAGICAIEWIYDAYGIGANPIEDDAGVAEIGDLAKRYGVAVRSLCADYFMDFPLVRVDGDELGTRQAALCWLIGRCRNAGIGRIVLPFVDGSSIENEADLARVIQVIEAVLPIAELAAVELHLETALAPDAFARLLAALPHRLVRVNYDAGNSASLGYHPADEFHAYGLRVGSVHVKDRVLGGPTVPLGTGDTDFAALATALRTINFAGDYTLQVARDAPGDVGAWARRNCAFVLAQGLPSAAQ